LTAAACGGLRSAPDCRTRRALLHLSYSCASPVLMAMLVTHDPEATSIPRIVTPRLRSTNPLSIEPLQSIQRWRAFVAGRGSIQRLAFAALLGTSDKRRWLIAPAAPSPRKSRRYRDGALVLETDFGTVDGQATLTDFTTRLFGRSAFVTSSISFRRNTMSAFGAWNFSLCTFSYCARQNRP